MTNFIQRGSVILNTNWMIVKCPKCNYEGNIDIYGDEKYFKIYTQYFGTPKIKCPKCGHSEQI